MESNLRCKSTLNQEIGFNGTSAWDQDRRQKKLTVNAITVQFEASVIENDVDSATSSLSEHFDAFPESVDIITQYVLFSGGKVITTRRLERLDLLFRHIDE